MSDYTLYINALSYSMRESVGDLSCRAWIIQAFYWIVRRMVDKTMQIARGVTIT